MDYSGSISYGKNVFGPLSFYAGPGLVSGRSGRWVRQFVIIVVRGCYCHRTSLAALLTRKNAMKGSH